MVEAESAHQLNNKLTGVIMTCCFIRNELETARRALSREDLEGVRQSLNSIERDLKQILGK